MSANCELIVIFLIYGQMWAIRKSDSRRKSVKLTFSLIATLYLSKIENRSKDSLRQL